MDKPLHARFSRRERQIMDALYALGEASANEVVERMGEPEAYDSVRVTLGILEKKGYVEHRQEGNHNVYFPTIPQEKARQSAMDHLLDTFFGGSPSQAALAFLDLSREEMSEGELERIMEWIEKRSEED